jgi:putative ABC transport system substrate-binding protein
MLDLGRRHFLTLLGGAAAAWPPASQAQQPRHLRRVGILMPNPKGDAESQSYVRAFRQELARLGWSENGNIQFDERWSTSNMDLVRADAANLVALNPDAIVIVGDRVIPILTNLTRSIPIVVALTSDPIASGAVETLARPGRNVTGFSLIEFSIFGKMLQILKGLAPGISRVAMMYNPDNPVGAAYLRAFEMVAGPLAVQPINLPIHDLADIERAVASLAEQGNGGVLIPPDSDRAVQHRNGTGDRRNVIEIDARVESTRVSINVSSVKSEIAVKFCEKVCHPPLLGLRLLGPGP